MGDGIQYGKDKYTNFWTTTADTSGNNLFYYFSLTENFNSQVEGGGKAAQGKSVRCIKNSN